MRTEGGVHDCVVVSELEVAHVADNGGTNANTQSNRDGSRLANPVLHKEFTTVRGNTGRIGILRV